MTLWVFTTLVFIASYFSGLLGALTGLGGGMIVIPTLVFALNVDIHYAIGASLISVIATSSATSIAYMKQGYTNVRIGIFLESGAVIGAVVGALLVPYVPTAFLAIFLGCILIASGYFSFRKKNTTVFPKPSHAWATAMKLESSYPTKQNMISYKVFHVPLALGLITIAGLLSGLLGIGAGALKVLAMDQAMGLPYKVSTTTSNYIIGITASVGAGFYFMYGYINPLILFPVLPGVLLGAFSGTKILVHASSKILRIIFGTVIFALALQLIYKGAQQL